MDTLAMLNPALRQQSLGRPLSADEAALAAALEAVFTSGTHAPADVASALQSRAVSRPSGGTEPWTEAVLRQELATLNAVHDAAYTAHGIGA